MRENGGEALSTSPSGPTGKPTSSCVEGRARDLHQRVAARGPTRLCRAAGESEAGKSVAEVPRALSGKGRLGASKRSAASSGGAQLPPIDGELRQGGAQALQNDVAHRSLGAWALRSNAAHRKAGAWAPPSKGSDCSGAPGRLRAMCRIGWRHLGASGQWFGLLRSAWAPPTNVPDRLEAPGRLPGMRRTVRSAQAPPGTAAHRQMQIRVRRRSRR